MKNKEITIDMINSYHCDHGEDFIDQNEHLFNGVTLSSFMAGLRPELAPLLWEKMNKVVGRRFSIQEMQEIYEDEFGYNDEEQTFYKDFIKALNTTTVSKERALKILEQYGETK